MSGIQKQITGNFFSRESFKPFYHLGPLCVLAAAAYGLCSGLSEYTILGYSHKHLSYRDLPRVEIELSLSCQKFCVVGQDDVWTYLLLTHLHLVGTL